MGEQAPRNRLCLECGAQGVAAKVTNTGFQTTVEYRCWACQHEWKMIFTPGVGAKKVLLSKTA
jgi:hypothetical protein